MQELIAKKEAARLLGGAGSPVSVSFINQLLASKKLPRVRLSYRVTRIPRKAVEDFVSARTVYSAATARL